jgi:hypothetical protein
MAYKKKESETVVMDGDVDMKDAKKAGVLYYWIPADGKSKPSYVKTTFEKARDSIGAKNFEHLQLSPSLMLLYDEDGATKNLPINALVKELSKGAWRIAGDVFVTAADEEGEDVDVKVADMDNLPALFARDVNQRSTFQASHDLVITR